MLCPHCFSARRSCSWPVWACWCKTGAPTGAPLRMLDWYAQSRTRKCTYAHAPPRRRRRGVPPPWVPIQSGANAHLPSSHHDTRGRRAVRVPGIFPAGEYPTLISVQNDCSHDCVPPPGCIYNLSIGGNRVCPEPPPPWIRPSPPSLRRTRAVSVTRPRRDPALPGAPAPPRRPSSRRRAGRHARAPGVCGVPAAWRLSA